MSIRFCLGACLPSIRRRSSRRSRQRSVRLHTLASTMKIILASITVLALLGSTQSLSDQANKQRTLSVATSSLDTNVEVVAAVLEHTQEGTSIQHSELMHASSHLATRAHAVFQSAKWFRIGFDRTDSFRHCSSLLQSIIQRIQIAAMRSPLLMLRTPSMLKVGMP